MAKIENNNIEGNIKCPICKHDDFENPYRTHEEYVSGVSTGEKTVCNNCSYILEFEREQSLTFTGK